MKERSFDQIFKAFWLCVHKEEGRYSLTSILIKKEGDNFCLVSTDGRMLLKGNFPLIKYTLLRKVLPILPSEIQDGIIYKKGLCYMFSTDYTAFTKYKHIFLKDTKNPKDSYPVFSFETQDKVRQVYKRLGYKLAGTYGGYIPDKWGSKSSPTQKSFGNYTLIVMPIRTDFEPEF
jgi:hypothetical protein